MVKTSKNSNSISISDLTFVGLLIIINIPAIIVLLYTSFGIAIGVTTSAVEMTLSDVRDMNIRIIISLATFIIINAVLIYGYRWFKTPGKKLSNPFGRRKTIGELMRKENMQ